jgi:receptor protein-tyrosine kinase
VLNISFGVIAGLFLTGGIVFLREKLDRSVRHPRMSPRLFNVPQLGVIPSASLLEPSGLFARIRRYGPARQVNGRVQTGESQTKALTAWSDGPSFMAESFRGTLASLLRDLGGKVPRMILVTSPGPAEGKTTITSNLGIALAETGRSVLLVDADFRRPQLHRLFGLDCTRGLVDLIAQPAPVSESDLDGVTSATGAAGLSVLVNRPTQSNVSKALYSPRLRDLLQSLRGRFDIILLDSPPLLHLADARLIAPWTDGVILVVRAGATDRESALEACQCIQADGLSLLGTVLNDWNPGKSHVRRNYYYDYSEEREG